MKFLKFLFKAIIVLMLVTAIVWGIDTIGSLGLSAVIPFGYILLALLLATLFLLFLINAFAFFFIKGDEKFKAMSWQPPKDSQK